MEMYYFEVWGLIDYEYSDLKEGTTHFMGNIAEVSKGKYFVAEEDNSLFLVTAQDKKEAIIKAAFEHLKNSDHVIKRIDREQVKLSDYAEDLAIENFFDITVIED